MAVLILAGLLAGGAVLTTDKTSATARDAHGHAEADVHSEDEHAHEDQEEHAEDEHAHDADDKHAKGEHSEVEDAKEEHDHDEHLKAGQPKDSHAAEGQRKDRHESAEGPNDRHEPGQRPQDRHAREGAQGNVRAKEATKKDSHNHASGAAQAGAHAEAKGHSEKVTLSVEQLKSAGIEVLTAAAAEIHTAIEFPGEIRFNEDRTAHVVPRVAGVVEEVPVTLGEQVKKGQLLAVIASTALSEYRSELLAAQQRLKLATATHNRERKLWQDKISAQQDYQAARSAMQEAQIAVQNVQQKLSALGATNTSTGSMNRFEIRAPFEGTIVEKHLSLGEAVKEDANIFTVSDLSSVWAEFAVSAKDIAQVRTEERAMVSSTAFDGKAEGRVSYVGSLIGEQTRTAKARITLTNPDNAWRPGLFVTVAVAVEEGQAPTTVSIQAVQTLNDKPVVFLEAPGGFVARHVTLGRSDGQKVEVKQGLKPSERYAASNSFILKSELGKASAEHKH